MISKEEAAKIINGIKLPDTDNYYEKTSADGFAFLGAAKANLGIEYQNYLKEIADRNYCLNAAWYGDKHTQYTYTLWTCIEFLRRAEDLSTLEEMYKRIDQIGSYPDGYMKYCSIEIKYRVPNMTSIAALVSAYRGDTKSVKKYLKVLEKNQVNGNWKYCKLDETLIAGNETVFEDAHHLALMIYQLRKLESEFGIKTKHIYLPAIDAIQNKNYAGNGKGKIGWAYPTIYLAVSGVNKELEEEYLKLTLKESINHSNFRTRAIAAFCLSEVAHG